MTVLRHDGAQYSPAVQEWFARALREPRPTRTAGVINREQLNFMTKVGLFQLNWHLYSAVWSLKPPWPPYARDPPYRCIADSGGYSIATGKLPINADVRHSLFCFSEEQAVAPILDAPTSGIGGPSGFRSWADCLDFTLENGLWAIANRTPKRTKLLNVFQGRNRREAEDWREAIKHLNDPRRFGDRALDGVAFAGATRLHLSITLEHIVRMRDERLIGEDAHFHFLGCGHPEIACALTAIQDELRATVGQGVEITFDSSTPFTEAAIRQTAYGDLRLTGKRASLQMERMPFENRWVGSDQPWPVRSPVADRLTLGDLCVKRGANASWDGLSYVLVALHNTWVLSQAIATANHRLRLTGDQFGAWMGEDLKVLIDRIRLILRSDKPMTLLQRWRAELSHLKTRAGVYTLTP